MKVLVTGATGFVGHHLAAEFSRRGHTLHALVWDPTNEIVPVGVEPHVGDVRDFASVREVVERVAPDHIVHLAGASSVGQSFAMPVETWEVNLTGTLAVLEAARACARPPRVLTVTSGEIYGRVALDELPVTEDTRLQPLSPYAASKAAADIAAVQYHLGYGLEVIRARAFNHIGPGQDARFVIPSIAQQLARAEREESTGSIQVQLGNIDTRRDFTDVRDVVAAYALLLEHGDPATPYLVCSGRSVSIRDLVEGLAAHCRRPVEIVSDPTRIRSGEQPDLYGSADRIRRDTGWTATIALEQTLADTLDWWRAQTERE